MRTCPLAVATVARLKELKFKIHRVWLAPDDNPDNRIDIVLCGGVTIGFNCGANAASVLRYRNERDMTTYPHRSTVTEIMHDVDVAFTALVAAGHKFDCRHDFAIGLKELEALT